MPGSTHNMTWLEAGFDYVPDAMQTDIGTGGAALTGIYVNMANYYRAMYVIHAPGGNAGDDLVISPLQALDSGGVTNKAMTFSRLWVKSASSLANLQAVGQWTQYDLTTPSSGLNLSSVIGTKTTVNGTAPPAAQTYDLAIETNYSVIVCEFLATDMDGPNGYKWLSVGIAAVSGATHEYLDTGWLLKDNRFPQLIPLSPLV